jgi:hypothetical protein
MLSEVIEKSKIIPVGDTRAKADIKGFFSHLKRCI